MEVANAFNNFFADIGPSLASQIDSIAPFPVQINKDCSLHLSPTTNEEVSTIIRNLKNTAAGYDCISAKILEFVNGAIAFRYPILSISCSNLESLLSLLRKPSFFPSIRANPNMMSLILDPSLSW